MTAQNNSERMLSMAFIPLAIAVNVGIGAIVKAFNLPLYFDSVGTIMATLMLGWRIGATVGVLGFIITAIFFNPFAIYFIGTQVVIAITVHVLAAKKAFKNFARTLLSGVLLGVIAAIVSAPVIILVFKGATGNGAALLTSLFVETGHQIVESVFLSGVSIEPIDKGLQCLLTFFILRSMPKTMLEKFKSGFLSSNGFTA